MKILGRTGFRQEYEVCGRSARILCYLSIYRMTIAQRKLHPAFWILIKIAIAVTGFILLRRSGAMSSEAVTKLAANPVAVGTMIATAIGYDFIRGISLYWLLRQTGRPTSLWLCVKAQYIAHFFNFLIPGQAGGLGAKSIYVSRLLKIPWKSALNVLSVELLMGFLALTAFTAINSVWLALTISSFRTHFSLLGVRGCFRSYHALYSHRAALCSLA